MVSRLLVKENWKKMELPSTENENGQEEKARERLSRWRYLVTFKFKKWEEWA